MCEQSPLPYEDGDVVWVKLSNIWWPGEVCGESRWPEGLQEALRRPPIAVVKFFQESTFEYVKNINDIYNYNCARKLKFIKKGLDLFRTKSKQMEKFPSDVTTAEKRTGGDPDILESEHFVPARKPDVTKIFASTKRTPKSQRGRGGRNNNNTGRSAEPQKRKETVRGRPSTPASLPNIRSVYNFDPEVRLSPLPIHHTLLAMKATKTTKPAKPTKTVNTPSTTTVNRYVAPSASNSTLTQKSNPYKCHLCDFSSSRLNVIVIHTKTHSNQTEPPAPPAAPPTQTITTIPAGKTKSKFNIAESPAKINVTVTEKKITKPATNKRNTQAAKRPPRPPTPLVAKARKSNEVYQDDENDDEVEAALTNSKTSPSPEVTKPTEKIENEIKESLLADWADWVNSDDDSDLDVNRPPPKKIVKEIVPQAHTLAYTKIHAPIATVAKAVAVAATPPIINSVMNPPAVKRAASPVVMKYRNIPKKDRRECLFDNFLDTFPATPMTSTETLCLITPDNLHPDNGNGICGTRFPEKKMSIEEEIKDIQKTYHMIDPVFGPAEETRSIEDIWKDVVPFKRSVPEYDAPVVENENCTKKREVTPIKDNVIKNVKSAEISKVIEKPPVTYNSSKKVTEHEVKVKEPQVKIVLTQMKALVEPKSTITAPVEEDVSVIVNNNNEDVEMVKAEMVVHQPISEVKKPDDYKEPLSEIRHIEKEINKTDVKHADNDLQNSQINVIEKEIKTKPNFEDSYTKPPSKLKKKLTEIFHSQDNASKLNSQPEASNYKSVISPETSYTEVVSKDKDMPEQPDEKLVLEQCDEETKSSDMEKTSEKTQNEKVPSGNEDEKTAEATDTHVDKEKVEPVLDADENQPLVDTVINDNDAQPSTHEKNRLLDSKELTTIDDEQQPMEVDEPNKMVDNNSHVPVNDEQPSLNNCEQLTLDDKYQQVKDAQEQQTILASEDKAKECYEDKQPAFNDEQQGCNNGEEQPTNDAEERTTVNNEIVQQTVHEEENNTNNDDKAEHTTVNDDALQPIIEDKEKTINNDGEVDPTNSNDDKQPPIIDENKRTNIDAVEETTINNDEDEVQPPPIIEEVIKTKNDDKVESTAKDEEVELTVIDEELAPVIEEEVVITVDDAELTTVDKVEPVVDDESRVDSKELPINEDKVNKMVDDEKPKVDDKVTIVDQIEPMVDDVVEPMVDVVEIGSIVDDVEVGRMVDDKVEPIIADDEVEPMVANDEVELIVADDEEEPMVANDDVEPMDANVEVESRVVHCDAEPMVSDAVLTTVNVDEGEPTLVNDHELESTVNDTKQTEINDDQTINDDEQAINYNVSSPVNQALDIGTHHDDVYEIMSEDRPLESMVVREEETVAVEMMDDDSDDDDDRFSPVNNEVLEDVDNCDTATVAVSDVVQEESEIFVDPEVVKVPDAIESEIIENEVLTDCEVTNVPDATENEIVESEVTEKNDTQVNKVDEVTTEETQEIENVAQNNFEESAIDFPQATEEAEESITFNDVDTISVEVETSCPPEVADDAVSEAIVYTEPNQEVAANVSCVGAKATESEMESGIYSDSEIQLETAAERRPMFNKPSPESESEKSNQHKGSCFDFFEEEDEIPLSLTRNNKRTRLSTQEDERKMQEVNKKLREEKDKELKTDVDNMLLTTKQPDVPDVPPLKVYHIAHKNSVDIVILDSPPNKKEDDHNLPPKERGKRIFKSRNNRAHNFSPVVGSLYDHTKTPTSFRTAAARLDKLLSSPPREERATRRTTRKPQFIERFDASPVVTERRKVNTQQAGVKSPTAADLQIAETLLNMEAQSKTSAPTVTTVVNTSSSKFSQDFSLTKIGSNEVSGTTGDIKQMVETIQREARLPQKSPRKKHLHLFNMEMSKSEADKQMHKVNEILRQHNEPKIFNLTDSVSIEVLKQKKVSADSKNDPDCPVVEPQTKFEARTPKKRKSDAMEASTAVQLDPMTSTGEATTTQIVVPLTGDVFDLASKPIYVDGPQVNVVPTTDGTNQENNVTTTAALPNGVTSRRNRTRAIRKPARSKCSRVVLANAEPENLPKFRQDTPKVMHPINTHGGITALSSNEPIIMGSCIITPKPLPTKTVDTSATRGGRKKIIHTKMDVDIDDFIIPTDENVIGKQKMGKDQFGNSLVCLINEYGKNLLSGTEETIALALKKHQAAQEKAAALKKAANIEAENAASVALSTPSAAFESPTLDTPQQHTAPSFAFIQNGQLKLNSNIRVPQIAQIAQLTPAHIASTNECSNSKIEFRRLSCSSQSASNMQLIQQAPTLISCNSPIRKVQSVSPQKLKKSLNGKKEDMPRQDPSQSQHKQQSHVAVMGENVRTFAYQHHSHHQTPSHIIHHQTAVPVGRHEIVKMTAPEFDKMSRLGYIEEKPAGCVLTTTGFKRIQEEQILERRLSSEQGIAATIETIPSQTQFTQYRLEPWNLHQSQGFEGLPPPPFGNIDPDDDGDDGGDDDDDGGGAGGNGGGEGDGSGGAGGDGSGDGPPDDENDPPGGDNGPPDDDPLGDGSEPTRRAIVPLVTNEIVEADILALPADNFGGPPHAFYLCQYENSQYIPMTGEPLLLDENNQLVPFPDRGQDFVNTVQLNTDDPSANTHYTIYTDGGGPFDLDHQTYSLLNAEMQFHHLSEQNNELFFEGTGEEFMETVEGRFAIEAGSMFTRPDHVVNYAIDVPPNVAEAYDIQQNQSPASLIVTTATNETPIMSALEQPSTSSGVGSEHTAAAIMDGGHHNLEDSLAVIGVHTTNVPTSLELPITVTNPSIANNTLSSNVTPGSFSTNVSTAVTHYSNPVGSEYRLVASTSADQYLQQMSAMRAHEDDILMEDDMMVVESHVELDSNSEIIPVTPESIHNHEHGTLDVSELTSDNSLSSEIPLQNTILLIRTTDTGEDDNRHDAGLRFGYIDNGNDSQMVDAVHVGVPDHNVINEYIDETQFEQPLMCESSAAHHSGGSHDSQSSSSHPQRQ